MENSSTERIAFVPYFGFNRAENINNEFFKLLDIDLERIIYIQDPTQFKCVIVPDEMQYVLGKLAQYKKKYTVVHEKIMNRVEAKCIKKIYLTRSQFKKNDCFNESYFEEFYKRRGFTVIAPEQLRIEEQIAYMKGAEEIVCTLGTLSHLVLFARPGTRLTALIRYTRAPLIHQMIVNHAKDVDFYIVDVSFNLMPTSNNVRSFLLGPTKYWREYLDAVNEASEEEPGFDMSKHVYDYLIRWCSMVSTEKGWTYGLARFDNFDVLNSLSTILFNKPLKRDDYKGSFKEKEKALNDKINRLESSRSWKITAPLRKIAGLARRARNGCLQSLSCLRQRHK